MLRLPRRRIAGRAGYSTWLRVALVLVAVTHRLGPSSSATTSTVDRALPSSAVQVHLGHSSIQVTMDRYGQLFPDALEHLADRLDAARTEGRADTEPLESRETGMAHALRQGVGGGGASQLRSSRCSVLQLASCHHQTGVPTGSSAPARRLQPIGVNAGACQKPRDQRV